MNNLYYTPKDKTIFWIAGYTTDNSTDNVLEKIDALRTNAETFAGLGGCDLSEVKTYYNDKPPRFQYMRVFYIQTETPHPDAIVCGPDRGFYDVLTT